MFYSRDAVDEHDRNDRFQSASITLYQAALAASKLGHGYLTYALVEGGLKTNAADKEPADGQVLLREWLDYATERVPLSNRKNSTIEETRQTVGQNQIRRSDSGNDRSLQHPRV